MESPEAIIAAHPFFTHVGREHVAALCDTASIETFGYHDPIFNAGEPAKRTYFILEGLVALYIHTQGDGAITVQTLGPGEVLGWSWIVPPYEWRFGAIAIKETRTVSLDGERLRSLCEENHDFGYAVLKKITEVMGQRLDGALIQLLDIYGAHTSA